MLITGDINEKLENITWALFHSLILLFRLKKKK